jgi:hypothetical protein
LRCASKPAPVGSLPAEAQCSLAKAAFRRPARTIRLERRTQAVGTHSAIQASIDRNCFNPRQSPMHLSENETLQAGNAATARAQRTITSLIADMRRTAAILEAELRESLVAAPTADPGAYNYPVLARSLGQRLQNVKATIAVLEVASPAGPQML